MLELLEFLFYQGMFVLRQQLFSLSLHLHPQKEAEEENSGGSELPTCLLVYWSVCWVAQGLSWGEGRKSTVLGN